MRPCGVPGCTKSLRREPARVSLHLSRAMTPTSRATIRTETIAEAMAIIPARCRLRQPRHACQSTRSRAGDDHIPAVYSPSLAARDGMNHQHFVLRARDFLDAFSGSDVEGLRSGLCFVLRDDAVHFIHVGGRGIVLENGGITLGRKRYDFGIHIRSPVGLTFGFRGIEAGGLGLNAILHPCTKMSRRHLPSAGMKNSLLLVPESN